MPFRTAHGNAADHGESLVWENAHADAAPAVPADAPVDIPRDPTGKVRDSEAARALAKLRRGVPNFVKRDVICTEEFRPFNDQRQVWTRQRIAELYEQTGSVSRGVGARARAAGWGIAFGEYLAEQAARTGDVELMERSMKVLAAASVEDEKARRLAVDEARARAKPVDPFAGLTQAISGAEPRKEK